MRQEIKKQTPYGLKVTAPPCSSALMRFAQSLHILLLSARSNSLLRHLHAGAEHCGKGEPAAGHDDSASEGKAVSSCSSLQVDELLKSRQTMDRTAESKAD